MIGKQSKNNNIWEKKKPKSINKIAKIDYGQKSLKNPQIEEGQITQWPKEKEQTTI